MPLVVAPVVLKGLRLLVLGLQAVPVVEVLAHLSRVAWVWLVKATPAVSGLILAVVEVVVPVAPVLREQLVRAVLA